MHCGGLNALLEPLQAIYTLCSSLNTLRASTRPLHAHQWHIASFNRPITCFMVVKSHPPSIYRPPTRFAVVKTDSTYMLCGGQTAPSEPLHPVPPTLFAVVKTRTTSLHRHTTRFAVTFSLLLHASYSAPKEKSKTFEIFQIT